MSEKKHYGLLLVRGNAAQCPHTVLEPTEKAFVPVPGLYRPDRPTPVGGRGEVSLDQARKLDKNKAVALKLVEIPAKDIEKLREQAEDDRDKARQAALALRKQARGSETEQVKDELEAATGQRPK